MLKNKLLKISWKKMAALTVAVAIVLSFGVYFVQGLPTEEQATLTLCTYEQSITGDYVAHLKPNILYDEMVGEGNPLYLNLVKYVDVNLRYDFRCNKVGAIKFIYAINSTVGPVDGWTKRIDDLVSVTKSQKTTSTSVVFDATFSYNITAITKLIDLIEKEIGLSSSPYELITQIFFNTTTQTDVGTISNPMAEYIKLTLTYMGGFPERNGMITVEVPESRLPGSITENLTKEIPSVLLLRNGMYSALFAWAAGASILTCWRYLRWRREFAVLPESEKIMKRYNIIKSKDMPALNTQTLASITELKKVADDYDSMMFHTCKGNRDIFFTTIENITYQYVVESAQTSNPPFPKETVVKPIIGQALWPAKRIPRFSLSRLAKFRAILPRLTLISIGTLLLAFTAWIIWYDTEFWNKSLQVILLGSRSGEAISLGIGARLVHYLILGLTLTFLGVLLPLLPNFRTLHNKLVPKIKSITKRDLPRTTPERHS